MKAWPRKFPRQLYDEKTGKFYTLEVGEQLRLPCCDVVMTKYGPAPKCKKWLAKLLHDLDISHYIFKVDEDFDYISLSFYYKGKRFYIPVEWRDDEETVREKILGELSSNAPHYPDSKRYWIKRVENSFEYVVDNFFLVGTSVETTEYEKDGVKIKRVDFDGYGYCLPSKLGVEFYDGKLKWYKILTPDGEKEIPGRPGFIELPMSKYFSERWKVREFDGDEYREIIPGEYVSTKYGSVYYEDPYSWRIYRKDGTYVRREGPFTVFYDKKDPYGLGGEHWTYVWNGKKGDAYYLPTIPSRQGVIYARIEEDNVTLYGIITPEGIYTVRVSPEKFFSGEQISVFDDDVEVIAWHLPFPHVIPFSESSYYVTRNDEFYIVIDGVVSWRNLTSYVYDWVWETVASDLGITRENRELVMHYGLKAIDEKK